MRKCGVCMTHLVDPQSMASSLAPRRIELVKRCALAQRFELAVQPRHRLPPRERNAPRHPDDIGLGCIHDLSKPDRHVHCLCRESRASIEAKVRRRRARYLLGLLVHVRPIWQYRHVLVYFHFVFQRILLLLVKVRLDLLVAQNLSYATRRCVREVRVTLGLGSGLGLGCWERTEEQCRGQHIADVFGVILKSCRGVDMRCSSVLGACACAGGRQVRVRATVKGRAQGLVHLPRDWCSESSP